jgi:hypothetical protein
MASYVASELAGASSNGARGSNNNAPSIDLGLAGCSCSQSNPIVSDGNTEENYQNAWNYLTGIGGLSEEAAAGVMGNLDKESAGTMDPQIVQFSANFPGDRSPELPLAQIEGKFGYGIAQWTFPSRQRALIAFAQETNRSTGSLDLQLDFLLKELRESYLGVYDTITTPGVTVRAASTDFLVNFERPASVIAGGGAKEAEINNRADISQKLYEKYRGTGGTFSGASCASAGSGEVVIDLDSPDTSTIPCAAGTNERDERIAAFSNGQSFFIKTCDIEGGFTVNSQLSGPMDSLVKEATAAGLTLGSAGSFRSMDDQIGVYERWCSSAGVTPTPPPYPKASRSDYQSCPGASPPGYSNHQMGFAIDFTCSGTTIPQSYADAQSNRCFVWLQQNAGKFGLYEFGKGQNRDRSGYEAWHWSVDGS